MKRLADRAVRTVRVRAPGAWWLGVLLLPLWLGWSFGSLGALQARYVADSHQEANLIAAAAWARLGDAASAGTPVLVALTGHRCTCAGAGDEARWARALLDHHATRLTLELPGAPYSTLAFDGEGQLRFAGSPAGAGCSGDPATLLAAVLDAPDGAGTPFIAPCVC